MFNKVKQQLGSRKYDQYTRTAKTLRNHNKFISMITNCKKVKQEEDKVIELYKKYPENSGILLACESIKMSDWE